MYADWNVSKLESSFRVRIAAQPESSLQFPAAALLHKEEGKRFLREAGNQMGSPSYVVTASLFFKRFLSLLSAALYCMSVRSVELNASLPNVTISGETDWKLPCFYLKEAGGWRPVPGERDSWRTQVTERLIRDTIRPLVSALASASGIHANVLWAHAAYIVHYYYDEWMREAETEELRQQIADDFRFLTKEADPKWFGRKDGNPLDVSHTVIPHPNDSAHPIRIRKQCCFQYRLSGGKCCYTCPMLNEEKRMEQILAYGH